MLYDEKYNGFQFIIAVKNVKEQKKLIKDSSTKLIKLKSKAFLKFSSKAKYWIKNNVTRTYITPKKEQVVTLLNLPTSNSENIIKRIKSKAAKRYIDKYVDIKAYEYKPSIRKTELAELELDFCKKLKIDINKKKLLYKLHFKTFNEYFLEDFFGKDKLELLYEKYSDKLHILIDTNVDIPERLIKKYKNFFINVNNLEKSMITSITNILVTNKKTILNRSKLKRKQKFLYSNYKSFYSKMRKKEISLYDGCNIDSLISFLDECIPTVPNKKNNILLKQNIINSKFCEKIVLSKQNMKKTISLQWFKRNIVNPLKDMRTKVIGHMRTIFFPLSKNFRTLKKYENRFEGKRCFLIGNGPSLTFSDLDLIKDEITFGCNLIYKIYDKTEWKPTFHCLADGLYAKKIGDELIDNICCDIFAVESVEKHLRKYNGDYNIVSIKNIGAPKNGSYKVVSPLAYHYPGGTVMSMMLCLAMYMGFKEIYLLGVDCTSSLSSSGHFIKGYMNDNIKRLDMKRIAKRLNKNMVTEDEVAQYYHNRVMYVYEKIENYAKKNNIKIYNSTRGGALEVYERKQLEDVIKVEEK